MLLCYPTYRNCNKDRGKNQRCTLLSGSRSGEIHPNVATAECGSLNERNGIGILVAFNYSTSEGMNFQLRCGFKEKITYYYTSLDLRITRIVTNVHCYSTNNAANHGNYLTSISMIYF